MPRFMFLLLLVTLLFTNLHSVFAQLQKTDPSVVCQPRHRLQKLDPEEKNTISADSDYTLELLPGQVFEGAYFYWTKGGTINYNLQKIPDVSWLELSPTSFTSTGPNDIVHVTFTFTAPAEPGIYTTSIKRPSMDYAVPKVTLIVTDHPEYSYSNGVATFPNDSLIIEEYTMYWGINLGDTNCVTPYFPDTHENYEYSMIPSVPWLKINPMTFSVDDNGSVSVTKTFTNTNDDVTLEIKTGQWDSYPQFTYWYSRTVNPGEYALQFDGEKTFVVSTYEPNPNTKSLMCWMKFNSFNNPQAIGINDYENHRFYIGMNGSNQIVAGMGDNYTSVDIPPLQTDQWYHFALTGDGSLAKVFLNGDEKERFTYTFTDTCNGYFFFGSRNSQNVSNLYIDGQLDDIQIWEKELSYYHVMQYRLYPPTGQEEGLVVYYPLKEGWGNYSKNFASNDYTAQFIYYPEWVPHQITGIKNEPTTNRSIKDVVYQNQPNPFNSSTAIQYNLETSTEVTICVYNHLGQRVRTIINNTQQNDGLHRIVWNGLDDFGLPVASGIYIYRLSTSDGFIQSKKMLYVK